MDKTTMQELILIAFLSNRLIHVSSITTFTFNKKCYDADAIPSVGNLKTIEKG